MKWLLKHLIPRASWIGHGNHKEALCFKHLLPEFKFAFNANAALLALWKFFHFDPLALGFMEKVTDIYGEFLVTPACQSTAKWTAHDWASKCLGKATSTFCTHLVYL